MKEVSFEEYIIGVFRNHAGQFLILLSLFLILVLFNAYMLIRYRRENQKRCTILAILNVGLSAIPLYMSAIFVKIVQFSSTMERSLYPEFNKLYLPIALVILAVGVLTFGYYILFLLVKRLKK